MVIGVGTDIVQVERMREVLGRQGRAFAERILCERELAIFDSKKQQATYLAKRFAAKEAVSKALGTGIGTVSWQDIEVRNNEAGAPEIHLSGNAEVRFDTLGAERVLLSLSDEREYVMAFVVLT